MRPPHIPLTAEIKRKDIAVKEHYVPYAGAYKAIAERWMVNAAIADIIANGRDKPCLVQSAQCMEIWIIPNFYGYHPHPHIKLAAIDSFDHTINCNETLEDVIKSQENEANIGKAKGRIGRLLPPTGGAS